MVHESRRNSHVEPPVRVPQVLPLGHVSRLEIHHRTYILWKTSESVEAEQVGIAESSYNAFLDKGLMYGIYSIWTGSGLHIEEDGVKGFPVKDLSHGAALQAQYKGLFAEVEYMHPTRQHHSM